MTRTGLCINGQCEATKPKSPSGKPMPVCLSWDWCKCKCHKQITDMYQIAGLPREEPDQNPDFHPDKGNFVMPAVFADTPHTVLSSANGTDAHTDTSDAVVTPSDALRATLEASLATGLQPVGFTPTPTGRKARGELEYEVLSVCGDYAHDVFDWDMCTPKYISEEIGKRNAAEPPSTGAIVEVFKRWEKLECAVCAMKPIRFEYFKMDDSITTLNMLKARAKRERRRSKADLKRGIRPAQPR